MKNRINISTSIFLIIIAVILSCIGTFFFLNSRIVNFGKSLQHKESLLNKVLKLDDIFLDKYPIGIPESKMSDGLIKGYLSAIEDKNTIYLDKANYRASGTDTSSIYSTLGLRVQIHAKGSQIMITYVSSGSPADKAGLRIGDIIVSVAHESVTKTGYFTAVQNLSGKENYEVEIEIEREGKLTDYKLKHKKYDILSVSATMVDSYGFIKIYDFSDSTAEEFKVCLDDMINHGASALIIDVRNNSGGNVTAASDTLKLLMPKGAIFTLQFKNDNPENIKLDDKFTCNGANEIKIPVMVLVNQYTSFAGELFAHSLLDGTNAILVGEKTAGEQSYCEIISLGDETAFRIPTAYYLPKSGAIFYNIGIIPTQTVEIAEETAIKIHTYEPENDEQFMKAASMLDNMFEAEPAK